MEKSDRIRMPLGRIEAKDPNDAKYPLRAALPKRINVTYKYYDKKPRTWIDQGSIHCPLEETPGHQFCKEQGFCVACAWTGFLNMSPIRTLNTEPILDIYHSAQDVDEWPGGPESYAGTSVRAGVKVLQSLGHIEQYLWAQNIDELVNFVLTKGPVVIGINWYNQMFDPQPGDDWLLRPEGGIAAGHAVVVSGVNLVTKRARIDNSWNLSWGKKGRAQMALDTLERLVFREDGEAVAAVERRVI
jgi:hypothetical protein